MCVGQETLRHTCSNNRAAKNRVRKIARSKSSFLEILHFVPPRIAAQSAPSVRQVTIVSTENSAVKKKKRKKENKKRHVNAGRDIYFSGRIET